MRAKQLKNFVNQLNDDDIVTAYQHKELTLLDLYAYHREETGGYPQKMFVTLQNTISGVELVASVKSREHELKNMGIKLKKNLTIKDLKDGKLMKIAMEMLVHYVASNISAFCVMFHIKDYEPIVKQVCHDIKKVKIRTTLSRND